MLKMRRKEKARMKVKYQNKTGVIETRECVDLQCENITQCEDGCIGFKSRDPEIKVLEEIYDVGESVICDFCGKDFSGSDAKGGLIFQSKAACPECTPRIKSNAIGYGESKFIRAECPDQMSFKDFVIGYRNGNNTVRVINLQEGDSIKNLKDILNR